jgi:hypothetical protein
VTASFVLKECKFLSKMPRLRHLHFSAKLDENEFQQFGRDIESLTCLTYLSLTFLSLSEDTADSLGENLTRLCNLKTLNMVLNLNVSGSRGKGRNENLVEELKARVFSKIRGSRVLLSSLREHMLDT